MFASVLTCWATQAPGDNHGLSFVQEFFADFARIADDESRHFGWCAQRLRELGYEYGCMPAHDLLWQGAQRSSGAWAVGVGHSRGCFQPNS